jgi:uncharacterized protein
MANEIETDDKRRSGRKCPICGKPAVARYQPFCSPRCQTIDLARWIGGNYRIPSEEDESATDDDTSTR